VGFAPLGSRQDSLTRPDNPCEADASSRSTRAGARQHTKTRGSAAEREVDARIQHRRCDEARWGREPTSRRGGMDRRPSSGVRWGSRYINKAMPPTLASGQSSSSSSDLSGSRISSRVEGRGREGCECEWIRAWSRPRAAGPEGSNEPDRRDNANVHVVQPRRRSTERRKANLINLSWSGRLLIDRPPI